MDVGSAMYYAPQNPFFATTPTNITARAATYKSVRGYRTAMVIKIVAVERLDDLAHWQAMNPFRHEISP